MNKMIFHIIFTSVLLFISEVSLADEEKNTNKNVTVITGTSTADGKSTVSKEILEECIESLPDASTLEAQITSKSEYLKGINGDINKNEFVITYTADIEINYMLYQKVLLIITTNSIQGKEPLTQIIEKRQKMSKHFASNSSQGDIYAGKSNRKYYFSTEEGAKKDVLKRAAIWLKQQSAVICKKRSK
ncbi:MAG: hypothetical protein PVI26_05165 [Chitinispirillia bacterium]|jgi:hypothetical protein